LLGCAVINPIGPGGVVMTGCWLIQANVNRSAFVPITSPFFTGKSGE